MRLLVEIKDAKGYTTRIEMFDLKEGDQIHFLFQQEERKKSRRRT